MKNMQELISGLSTAFINNGINSNLAYRPEFVSNDYKNGKKEKTKDDAFEIDYRLDVPVREDIYEYIISGA